MTFIPDGSTIDYDRARGINPATQFYAWGWVGHFVASCNEWKNSKQKRDFLKALFAIPVKNRCRGSHDCAICGDTNISNGTRTLITNTHTFRCPAGVDHYINHHNYVPPQIVIDAFLSTSLSLEEVSKLIANDIMQDLVNRKGFDNIDSNVKMSMVKDWEKISRNHMKNVDVRKIRSKDLGGRPHRPRNPHRTRG